MSAKWSTQSFKGTIADADVFLIIDSEAGPVDNKQVLFCTLALAAQTPWRGDIDAATFNLDNLTSVDLNNALGTNPIISALQSASESTVVLGSNFQVSSGYIDMAEIATPANPATDVGRLYVRDEGGTTNLFFRDSAGTETDIITGGGGGHVIEDEGTPLTQRAALNFIGAGVTVTDNAGTDATDVTIPGGSAFYQTVQDEGTPLTQRANLDFVGAGVTVTDGGAGPDSSIVTIAGGASPLTTKGDLFGFDTGDARIPIGVTGQVLTADSTEGLGLRWGDIPTTLTTQGDLLGRDVSGEARIPIGFPGQVLTVQTAQPTQVNWLTPTNLSPVSVIGHVSVGAPTNSVDVVLSETINFDDTVNDIELVGTYSLAAVDTVRVTINNLTTASYTTTCVFVDNAGVVTGQNISLSTSGWQTGQTVAGPGFTSSTRIRIGIGGNIAVNARPAMELWETCGGPSGNLYRAGRGIFEATPAPTNITSIKIETASANNFETGSSFTVTKRKTS
jgi:hypothetical protein